MTLAEAGFERRYLEGLERARQYSATLAGPSLFERLARLPPELRERVLAELSTLDLARLLYHWPAWARPKQNPDVDRIPHRILFLLAGRGFGKSLTGAQRVRQRVERGARSIGIVGPTLSEIEKYMIGGAGGADGLLAVFPPAQRPVYKPHKRLVEFHTGAIGYVNTAEEPEFRGPNLDTVWADEPGKWRYLRTIWSNIELATRLPGKLPLELTITGTPVPLQQFREWIADDETITILGTMFENASNLDRSFVKTMARRYGGTRIGRQELDGEILADNPDALFHGSLLDAARVESAPDTLEVVVAVDPAISVEEGNDETGILVIGIDVDGHLYVLGDATAKMSPEKWGAVVIQAYEQHRAVAVVCERNRGGDLVAANVRAAQERKRGRAASQAIKIVEVQATKGKRIRAEPVGALHERGLIHLVGGLPDVAREITEWNPRLGGVSPNRLDALVWGCWYLARLGDDEPEKRDPRAAFAGLAAASAALRPAGEGAAAGLARLLPRSGWGSRL